MVFDIDKINLLIKYLNAYATLISYTEATYHPYPEDLRVPEVWNNTAITYDFNTPQITGKNVEVIDAWMREKENLFKRQKVRTLQFSEQGVNTRDNSAEQQNIQAAGVAYYWKKVKDLPTMEAFQYHRCVDHPNEGGLQFGLWTNAENTTALEIKYLILMLKARG